MSQNSIDQVFAVKILYQVHYTTLDKVESIWHTGQLTSVFDKLERKYSDDLETAVCLFERFVSLYIREEN